MKQCKETSDLNKNALEWTRMPRLECLRMLQLALDSTYDIAGKFDCSRPLPRESKQLLAQAIAQLVPAAHCCSCGAVCNDTRIYLEVISCELSGPLTDLINTNSVTYVAKNHANCEWLDGIPYSVYKLARSMGRGSRIKCLRTWFRASLISVPQKNVIYKI